MTVPTSQIDGWREFSIGELAEVKTGPFGSSLHASDYKLVGTPIITVEHLGERSITEQNLPLVGVYDTRRLAAYKLVAGDIVFSRVGSIDRSALVSSKQNGWLFSGRLLRLRGKSKFYCPELLIQIFKTPFFLDQVRAIAVGQTMPSLNTKILNEITVRIPELLSEQQSIAASLSDVDSLIDTLDLLVAKKRAMRQGAMQQLLTGKTRLPGFSGEWEEVLLGSPNVSTIKSGGTPSTAIGSFWNGNIPWVTPTDITSTVGKYLSSSARKITLDGLANCSAQMLPSGALLLCSRATVGEIRIATLPVSTNQGFKAVVAASGVSNEFLYYKLLTMKDQMLERSFGSTFLELPMREAAALPFLLPSYAEQQAIAEVLCNMDAEIDALVARREKTALIKTGMMQELLTGRTRLL